MKVVNFESKDYDSLLAFSKKTWPEKSEQYLKYRLFQVPEQIEDNRNNLLLINDEDEIVGCALYMPTKARINGNEKKIFWSHDMFVEEKYRGVGGLLLILEMHENKSTFGFGMTDINYKINKELGTNFIGHASHYLILNFWSYKLLLTKLKLIKLSKPEKYDFPDKLKVGQHIFNRISTEKELNIPANGYWCDSGSDIEFVRDAHFLNKRFFESFNNYYFYKLQLDNPSKADECYFVVRPSLEGGLIVLSIVDFRFKSKKPEQYKMILKAASILGRKNKFTIVTLRTSFKFRKINLYPFVYRRFPKQHIVTTYPVESNHRIFVTNADSDSDFLAENYSF